MTARLTDVLYVRDYVLRVAFSDGAAGEIDLSDELEGEMFEPLQAIELFREARFDSELHTVVWPNGADLAPEFLRDRLRLDA